MNNNDQNINFYTAIHEVTESILRSSRENIDLKSIDNKIQQMIGILSVIDNMNLKGAARSKAVHTLKTLVHRKKILNYGHTEKKIEELIA